MRSRFVSALLFSLLAGPSAPSAYNPAGMLDSVNNKLNSTSVSKYDSMVYDGVFNLTDVDCTMSGTSYGGTDSYTYDSKDRLTALSSSRNYGFSESFAYDSAGNPTTYLGNTRTYNSNNQRTSSGNFAYDGNGNPTTYTGGGFGTATCTYDRENRLTGIGSGWSAKYRADGLRAYKDVGSTRLYYLYDNGNPVLELDSSGNVVAVNGYGGDGLYARWSAWNNSSTTYYTFDQQGNGSQRYDGNGNLLASSMNDAYGYDANTSNPSDPFSYNAKWGYYLDRESGLYLCQHRYYDPGAGRWLTRDPIGYAGGINAYGYCQGEPTNRWDPAGMFITPWTQSWFYQLVDRTTGAHLKYGVTSRPSKRYSNAFLERNNAEMIRLREGPRYEMLACERCAIRSNPWGALQRERWRFGRVGGPALAVIFFGITALTPGQGPRQAFRDLVFADEVEAVCSAVGNIVGHAANNLRNNAQAAYVGMRESSAGNVVKIGGNPLQLDDGDDRDYFGQP